MLSSARSTNKQQLGVAAEQNLKGRNVAFGDVHEIWIQAVTDYEGLSSKYIYISSYI